MAVFSFRASEAEAELFEWCIRCQVVLSAGELIRQAIYSWADKNPAVAPRLVERLRFQKIPGRRRSRFQSFAGEEWPEAPSTVDRGIAGKEGGPVSDVGAPALPPDRAEPTAPEPRPLPQPDVPTTPASNSNTKPRKSSKKSKVQQRLENYAATTIGTAKKRSKKGGK